MTPDEADKVIAEKVMGWHAKYGLWWKDLECCTVTGYRVLGEECPPEDEDYPDYDPSRDRNHLAEAVRALTSEQRREYLCRIDAEIPPSIRSGPIARAGVFHYNFRPSVCAVFMAEVVKE